MVVDGCGWSQVRLVALRLPPLPFGSPLLPLLLAGSPQHLLHPVVVRARTRRRHVAFGSDVVSLVWVLDVQLCVCVCTARSHVWCIG